MRSFVFLLVFANLLFFAWTRGYLSANESDALRAGEPLRADQIRIVSNDKPPEEKRASAESAPPPAPSLPYSPPPAPAPDPATPDETCLALNDVSSAEADSIGRLFAESLPAVRLARTAMPGSVSHGILVSPFRSRREAENKVAELKKLGVSEFFIMAEDSGNFAISLGLFSTPAAAESALATLKEKGVRTARLAERQRRSTPSRIEFRGPRAQEAETRQIFEQVLPQARPTACGR